MCMSSFVGECVVVNECVCVCVKVHEYMGE